MIPDDVHDDREPEMSPEEVARLHEIQTIHQLESLLVQRIEEIEGRVPSDDEVRKHSERIRLSQPGDMEESCVYCWRGQPIVHVRQLGLGFQFTVIPNGRDADPEAWD